MKESIISEYFELIGHIYKVQTRLHLQGKVARRAIVCVVQIFRTHIVQIFRTHIVQIYLEHSFAISRLVYASKIV